MLPQAEIGIIGGSGLYSMPGLTGIQETAVETPFGAPSDAFVVGKRGGTYICMEGPQFSTKAESNLYRSWGMDVIGMTNLQEAKLAREAEICYVTVAMVTDYDCWHPHHDSVTVDQIVSVLLKNAENACNVVREAVAAMPKERSCRCGSALAHAILTDRKMIPSKMRERLKLILGKYLETKTAS